MTRVSSGSVHKGGQKYQNEVAFKHNPSSKLTKKILAMPIRGLCPKCTQIIEWRKKYRKYKPLTVPKKCICCEEKRVKDAYHILCEICATKSNICAKCRESREFDEQKLQNLEEELPEDFED